MSISTYKRWMKEAYLYEADDDNYVHVGGGKYKEVNKRTGEALPNSPSYIKKDSGGYEMVDDDDPRLSKDDDKEKKTPVSIDIDAAGGLGGDDEEGGEEKPSDEPEGKIDDKDFEEDGAVDNALSDESLVRGERKPETPAEEAAMAIVKDAIENDIISSEPNSTDMFYNIQDKIRNGEYERQDFVDSLKGDEQGRTGTEEIKVINGKKYRAIKESVDKRISVKEVYRWLKGLEEYRYRKIPNVDVRRIASFANNGLSETDLPKSLQKKWENAKYSKEKTLADRFIKQRISQKLTQTESKHPIKENYDRLFTNRVVL